METEKDPGSKRRGGGQKRVRGGKVEKQMLCFDRDSGRERERERDWRAQWGCEETQANAKENPGL